MSARMQSDCDNIFGYFLLGLHYQHETDKKVRFCTL